MMGVECQWHPEVESFLLAVLGPGNQAALNQAICVPPKHLCVRVNTLQASVKEVIDHITSHISPQSSTGGDGQAQLVPFVHPQVPIAIMVPCEGPLDVDYSLAGGHEVIISRKAGEAVMKGAPVYAPGVLACSKGMIKGQLVTVTAAVEQLSSTVRGIARGTTINTDQQPPSQQEPGQAQQNQAEQQQQECLQPHLAAEQGGAGHRYVRVGVGRAMMSRTQVFKAERGLAVSMEHPLYRVPAVSGLDGKIMLQGLPSIVAALALAPVPGSRVLDMCASPGGKTTVIAQLMNNQGEVIALDRTHVKAAQVMHLAAELGATCIKAYRMDATKAVLKQASINGISSPAPAESVELATSAAVTAVNEKVAARQARKQAARLARGLSAQPASKRAYVQPASQQTPPPASNTASTLHQEPASSQGLTSSVGGASQHFEGQEEQDDGDCGGVTAPAGQQQHYDTTPPAPGFVPESFDAVLLDAPCSALGLRPRWVQTADMGYLKQCGLYSRKLLDVAVQLLKPGGRLVYSTCTISPLENEANVRYVLDKYSGVLQLVKATPCVGGPGLTEPGAAARGDQIGLMDGMWLTAAEAELVQRFEPYGPQDTNGFFVSAFIKLSSSVTVS